MCVASVESYFAIMSCNVQYIITNPSLRDAINGLKPVHRFFLNSIWVTLVFFYQF